MIPTGETRLWGIIGDPIAQVKSPAALTAAMEAGGHNVVVVPMHVGSNDVPDCLAGLARLRNFDGFIATVPHKFAAYAFCDTATDRASLVAAVNIVKREPDGSWRGDMVDGLGFLNGLAAAGIPVEGQRALLVGAGGAGSAIAHSLLEAGLGGLSIYDTATERSADLIDRLAARGHHSVRLAKRADPSGHTLVVNATPLGMRRSDPFPVNVEKLTSDMAVADVITAPETTPLLEAAACRGCAVQNGTAMYRGLQALLAASWWAIPGS